MSCLIVLGGAGNVGISLLDELLKINLFKTIYVLDINTEPLNFLKDNIKIKIINSNIIYESYLEKILFQEKNNEIKIINLVAKDYPVTKDGLNKEFNNPFSISTNDFISSLEITTGSTYNLFHQLSNLGFYKVDVILISSIYEIKLPDPDLYSDNKNKIFKPIAYSSGKAAQSPLLKQAARILGPHGGKCNCLSFGGIRSNQNKIFIEKYSKKSPQGKMIEMHDVIKMILWLLIDAPDSINGENIMVDGGFTC